MTKTNLSAMPTPNPNTIKFLPERTFFESGTVDFPHAEKANKSPLPKALFQIEGIDGIMIGFNFISVSKKQDIGWDAVLESVRDTITEHLDSDIFPIDKELLKDLSESQANLDVVTQSIIKILDEEIRPAIAMDGGDIAFVSFEDGVLTLRLQGACSSCPASSMTLKMGIENRLKEEFPELKEVVQEGILL